MARIRSIACRLPWPNNWRDDWFLGAITNEDSRKLEIDLDFLQPGITFTAQIYRDGTDAHWETNPYALLIEEKTVTSASTLKLDLAAGGGTAIRFKVAEES
jgi:alpha-glucosidase